MYFIVINNDFLCYPHLIPKRTWTNCRKCYKPTNVSSFFGFSKRKYDEVSNLLIRYINICGNSSSTGCVFLWLGSNRVYVCVCIGVSIHMTKVFFCSMTDVKIVQIPLFRVFSSPSVSFRNLINIFHWSQMTQVVSFFSSAKEKFNIISVWPCCGIYNIFQSSFPSKKFWDWTAP